MEENIITKKKTCSKLANIFANNNDFLTSSEIISIFQNEYIAKLFKKYRDEHNGNNDRELIHSFLYIILQKAKDDFLLFCILNYRIVGLQDLDLSFHVYVLTAILQLHSNNLLYLDEDFYKKYKKKRYVRDENLPQLEQGDYIINIPPGHGKTSICNVLYSAWLLGKRPTMKILYATCVAGEVATRLTDTHIVMDSPIYKAIFGKILKKNCGSTMVETYAGGYKRGKTTNINKAITGMDAHFLLIDDPNNATGDSDSALKSVHKWYSIGAKPRKRIHINTMPTLIQQQRTDKNDLSGFLLTEAERNKLHINHFALKEWEDNDVDYLIDIQNKKQQLKFFRPKGYLYLPKNEKMQEDRVKELETIRLDEERWQTQFQQIPYKRGGSVFKEEYFSQPIQRDGVPYLQLDYTFITTDLSYTDNIWSDNCCLCWWGIKIEGDIKKMFLLDYIWEKFPQEYDRDQMVYDFFNKCSEFVFIDDFGRSYYNSPVRIYIEKPRNEQTIPHLQRELGDIVYPLSRTLMLTEQSMKIAISKIYTREKRFGVILSLLDDGKYSDMLSELLSFDGKKQEGAGKHDDFVDCVADALRFGSQLAIE